MLNKIKVTLQLLWISIQLFFDSKRETKLSRKAAEQRQQMRQNYKLQEGVRRMNDYLRSMSPSERARHMADPQANLIEEMGKRELKDYEKQELLRLQAKVLKNPTDGSEEAMVRKAVANASIYQKEQELQQLRKRATYLRSNMKDSPELQKEFVEVSRQMKLVTTEIRSAKSKL